tara:strand:- start:149 stop:313 length:165 start_codon:yes stop_codon:yes gene_type:complete
MAHDVNLLWAGQSGTGESHLAIALGLEAIHKGYRVCSTSVADLMDQVNVDTASG